MTTKYVSVPGSCGSSAVYHTDKNCKRIKSQTKEVTERYISWHDLDMCEWCEKGTSAGSPL